MKIKTAKILSLLTIFSFLVHQNANAGFFGRESTGSDIQPVFTPSRPGDTQRKKPGLIPVKPNLIKKTEFEVCNDVPQRITLQLPIRGGGRGTTYIDAGKCKKYELLLKRNVQPKIIYNSKMDGSIQEFQKKIESNVKYIATPSFDVVAEHQGRCELSSFFINEFKSEKRTHDIHASIVRNANVKSDLSPKCWSRKFF